MSYRIYHLLAKVVIRMNRFPQPELLTGENAIDRLPERIQNDGIKKVLIVTDKVLVKLGLMNGFLKKLDDIGVAYYIFSDVTPNPTIGSIESCHDAYYREECDGFVAFGGGSPMDCCKVAAARVGNPTFSVRRMQGYFKVKKALPPLYAVPTTSGTGSETTVAAVITDEATHEKFVIGDLKLVPRVAVLDPVLTLGLPPHMTSTTGMDALTHAVEAFIGKHKMHLTDDAAVNCITIVMRELESVYNNGKDLGGRYHMALAAYYGGVAFTRASVGNVHAIAHQLGGLYGIPHGLANAVILPLMLDYYGERIHKHLAYLAVVCELGTKEEAESILAQKFIDRIKDMNERMGIPEGFTDIMEKDIPLIAQRACNEANPTYPVPVILNTKQCQGILRSLMLDKLDEEESLTS